MSMREFFNGDVLVFLFFLMMDMNGQDDVASGVMCCTANVWALVSDRRID